MRKLLVLSFVVVSLAAAGAAVGKTSKTVTISHTGYTPTAVSITVGDAVVFANTDTVAHTVNLSSTTGVHCSGAVPLAIPAGQSASCTFSSAGNFKLSDAANKGKAFRGTITVTPPLVSSLTVTPTTVVYGRPSTIAGQLTSGQSGQAVEIHAQPCRATKATVVASVTTTAGGSFSYDAQPVKRTTYTLSSKGQSGTAGAEVGVRPRLHLGKIGRHHYKLQVTAADSFVGKVATFQRYKRHRGWVKVKRVRLRTAVEKTAPTVVTSATFRSNIKARLRVRASLGSRQTGACYSANRSNTIHS